MPDRRLCRVVRRLQLREVRDVAAHRRCRDEAAVREAFQLVLLLLSPYPAGCSRAVVDAIDVYSHDGLVVVQGTVDHVAFRPWYTCIGNEDIETVVEFLDLGCDSFLYYFGVGDVDLVCLAYPGQIGPG